MEFHCFKCGKTWTTRKTNGEPPVQCPICKRTDYATPKKKEKPVKKLKR